MPVKKTIPFNSGMFFITFTCYQWQPLIEKVNGYTIVYKWFDHLKSKGHFINGYVIMPNPVHVLISFVNTSQSINAIIGNGKRFMAYEIIQRLQQNGKAALLQWLSRTIETGRRENNKQHNVWELSFDRKDCRSKAFSRQKLDYMHNNPCTGKWQLAVNAIEYMQGSAKYYLTGEQGVYVVTNFMEMEDVDFKGGRQ